MGIEFPLLLFATRLGLSVRDLGADNLHINVQFETLFLNLDE